jgi:hypothetical protein
MSLADWQRRAEAPVTDSELRTCAACGRRFDLEAGTPAARRATREPRDAWRCSQCHAANRQPMTSTSEDMMHTAAARPPTPVSAVPGLDIQRLARITHYEGATAVLAGLDTAEVQEVAAVIVADLHQHPWTRRPDGRLEDGSVATWGRIRSTPIGPRRVPLDRVLYARPKFTLHGAIRQVVDVLEHARAHRAELAAALHDLDAALEGQAQR